MGTMFFFMTRTDIHFRSLVGHYVSTTLINRQASYHKLFRLLQQEIMIRKVDLQLYDIRTFDVLDIT